MGAAIEIGFDYAIIDPDGRDDVRDAATRIRIRMSRTVEDIIEIGRDLSTVKEALGHGYFTRWIEAEFGMSVVSASRFMNVAERFGGKSFTVKDFSPSVLYALASPSTDEAVVEEVLERSAAGETISPATVKALKDEWASERKDLKRQLDEQKLKTRDAKSTQSDFGDQLKSLQLEMAQLRDERDTLRHEIEAAPKASPVIAARIETVRPVEGDREARIAGVLSDFMRLPLEDQATFLQRASKAVLARAA